LSGEKGARDKVTKEGEGRREWNGGDAGDQWRPPPPIGSEFFFSKSRFFRVKGV